MPEALLDTPVSFDFVIRAIHWGSAILLFVTTLIFSFVGSQTSEDQRLFWGTLFALEVLGSIYAMSQLSLAYLRADWVIALDPSRLYTLHLFLLPAMIIGILGVYLTKTEKSND
jgi:quinol-cytochrome oxidoreductase complex cytochrome b subunit